MAAISTITLADGQASPANHTFNVMTAQSGTDSPARWVDTAGGIYAGYPQLTMLVRRTSNRSTKVQVKVTLPKLAADETTLIHSSIASIDVTLPDTMSLQERKDIAAYVANALDNTIIRDGLVNLSPAF